MTRLQPQCHQAFPRLRKPWPPGLPALPLRAWPATTCAAPNASSSPPSPVARPIDSPSEVKKTLGRSAVQPQHHTSSSPADPAIDRGIKPGQSSTVPPSDADDAPSVSPVDVHSTTVLPRSPRASRLLSVLVLRHARFIGPPFSLSHERARGIPLQQPLQHDAPAKHQ